MAVSEILVSHFGRGLNRQHGLHGGHERAFTKMIYAAQACEATVTNIMLPVQIAVRRPSLRGAAEHSIALKGFVALWWGL